MKPSINHNGQRKFPRFRSETGEPPALDEITQALREHWRFKPTQIRPAGSRRVWYIDLPGQDLIARANPGWDGPTHPEVIVDFVDHLSRSRAPVPEIIPTATGDLTVEIRDSVLSVESRLKGEPIASDENSLSHLHQTGKALRSIHNKAESFQRKPGCRSSVSTFVETMYERSRTRFDDAPDWRTITSFFEKVFVEHSRLLEEQVPWILCHGDVNRNNILFHAENISFTDFDSAQFAPALIDVAMTRLRWPGARQEMLVATDAAPCLAGYHVVSPLSKEERDTWPIIASVYYVEFTSFLLHRRLLRREFDEAERLTLTLKRLSREAIDSAHEVLRHAQVE